MVACEGSSKLVNCVVSYFNKYLRQSTEKERGLLFACAPWPMGLIVWDGSKIAHHSRKHLVGQS
jgi:hypothetical protein